ncbi:hypothetical protein Tco_1412397 [Tanacetum coccineum]
MMMENKRYGELMIENHWMNKLLKEVLMIDELSIGETDKVSHTMEMDMLKLVVEVKCFGKCVDEFDKVTVLFGEMQLKQEDRSYIHALNKLHLHVVHVVLNHNLWDVIINEDLEEEPAPTTGETFAPPAPKTTKQLAARRNQERVKSILLLAIPDEYLLKFHIVADAKSLWEAIKSRFGAYDRFQKLISQLEVHGAPISKEDINQKFLRSLPSSWNRIALIIRNKPDINEIDIDDLYNNLRVYEDELKRSSGSSQNLAFLSFENTNSTNEVSTASGDFGVSNAGGINQVLTTPSAHDIAYSFLA